MSNNTESLKAKTYRIIFEAETPAGKGFDVMLLFAILGSIFVVIIDSIPHVHTNYAQLLLNLEWLFTIGFTLEYILRIYSSPKARSYIFSFFGLIDLLSILPTFLSVFFDGMESLLVIRGIRLLRVFRVLKLVRFSKEGLQLLSALRRSLPKITVFLGTVLTLVIISGSAMYLIEGEENGFTSIPKGMYWSIVTMTTVGYGDIVPLTDLGKVFASCLMIMGYGIIAVPTGIISVEIAQGGRELAPLRACQSCKHDIHSSDANFCNKCGSKLN